MGTENEASSSAVDALRESMVKHNEILIQSMKETPLGKELLDQTIADAELSRMAHPRIIQHASDVDFLLTPRFAVVQPKPDGSVKTRPVDNFSWSSSGASKKKRKLASINGIASDEEPICHDTLDGLIDYMKRMWEQTGKPPGLFKVDIDAAFRRVPIRPCDRWSAGVAFKFDDCIYVSQHFASPFGAASSNFSWDRLGNLLAVLTRSYLRIGCFRYVDDYFGAESVKTAEHAALCLARLFRALLGKESVADKKIEWGAMLTILGVDIMPNEMGCRCRPSRDKARRWCDSIAEALSNDLLMPGDASKLAGKLNWAVAALFKRFGRAMLRPVYDQCSKRSGAIDFELRRALRWWLVVLNSDICETRLWRDPDDEVFQLFCDASGDPPHIGAVLMSDKACAWTHMEVPKHVLSCFKSRHDNQIMGLELLSIALGISTFAASIAGKRVIIHSDNTGSEVRDSALPCVLYAFSCCRYLFGVEVHAAGTTRNLCIAFGKML